MATGRTAQKSINEYISAFSPNVQTILERMRLTISKAAPDAPETISRAMRERKAICDFHSMNRSPSA